MRRIVITTAGIIAVLVAWFIFILYKTGEGMHMYRCGWRQPDDGGFM